MIPGTPNTHIGNHSLPLFFVYKIGSIHMFQETVATTYTQIVLRPQIIHIPTRSGSSRPISQVGNFTLEVTRPIHIVGSPFQVNQRKIGSIVMIGTSWPIFTLSKCSITLINRTPKIVIGNCSRMVACQEIFASAKQDGCRKQGQNLFTENIF